MKLVLVAEDEFGSAEILELFLEATGYRVVLAQDGQAAWDLLKGEKPALILSDFMMPRMNGAELGEAVRGDAMLRDIPFVFISGTDEAIVRNLFRHYDAFLCKPYDVDQLLATIEGLVANGRPEKKLRPQSEEPVQNFLRDIGISPPKAG